MSASCRVQSLTTDEPANSLLHTCSFATNPTPFSSHTRERRRIDVFVRNGLVFRPKISEKLLVEDSLRKEDKLDAVSHLVRHHGKRQPGRGVAQRHAASRAHVSETRQSNASFAGR